MSQFLPFLPFLSGCGTAQHSTSGISVFCRARFDRLSQYTMIVRSFLSSSPTLEQPWRSRTQGGLPGCFPFQVLLFWVEEVAGAEGFYFFLPLFHGLLSAHHFNLFTCWGISVDINLCDLGGKNITDCVFNWFLLLFSCIVCGSYS